MHTAMHGPCCRRIALSTMVSMALAWSAPLSAADSQIYENQLPVAVRVDGMAAAADFIVLQHGGTLYLPLLNTASLLSFVVEAPTAGQARGHRGDPAHGFSIDAGSGAAIIDGLAATIAADDLIVADDMLWVSARLASRLLPIIAKLDTRNFVLDISATGELPAAAERRRAKEHAALIGTTSTGTTQAPRAQFPYRAWQLPSGDLQLLANTASGASVLGLRALLAGDIAYMNGALFVGAGNDGIDAARLRMTRESVDGGVFGWRHLTRAEVGDVYATHLPLVGSARGGRGFTLSSFPLDERTEFDTTLIQGDAPPSWQVEIYGNGRLLGFQQVGTDGRYAFDGLPVLFGENQYRLVFYGPGGERREELRSVRVGADRVPAGDWRARVAAYQPGQGLFDIGGVDSGNKATAASVEVRYGLMERLTVGGFVARAPMSADIDAPLDDYVGGVLRASLGAAALSVNVVAQGNRIGGDLGAIAQIAGTSVSVRLSQYGGLRTPESSRAGDLLDREMLVRLNRPLPATWLGGADVGLEVGYGEYAGERLDLRVAMVLRHQIGTVALEHELQHQRIGYAEDASTAWQLRSAATFTIGGAHLRAQMAARPDGIEGASLSGLWSLGERTHLGFNYSHQMEQQEDDLSAFLARDFGWFIGRMVAGHGDTQGSYASLELSLSFAFDQQRQPVFSSRRLASGGLAAPFVFLDRDNDGRFDADRDEPLADVIVAVDHSARPDRSNASGELLIDSLPTLSRTDLSIDPQSLSDPFYAPRIAAMNFQARPGTVFRAEFPVVETGSIQGHVYRSADGAQLPLSGASLTLVDRAGNTIAQAVSQVDGYYVFERVIPGPWQVRVDSRGKILAEHAAAITAANLQIDKLDFVL
jgi:hypothetical protein